MDRKRVWTIRLACGLALLALLAVPVWAVESVRSGADYWHTSTGFTFTSFRSEPIPAGFFCPGSKPFTGIVNLQGVPLATSPAGALGNIDTIVRRLDSASFNEKGEARTRIQLMALSLASVKPVDTGCGLYNVTASLAGEQPITEMKVVRTSDNGGYYVAPLKLNVKLVFTPVSGRGERRELTHPISLGPGSRSMWAYAKGGAAQIAVGRTGMVKVDTDGDRIPDSMLPAPSNFVAGMDPAAISGADPSCPSQSCHCTSDATDPYTGNAGCDHLHCVDVRIDCTKPIAPIRPATGTPSDPTTDPSTGPTTDPSTGGSSNH